MPSWSKRCSPTTSLWVPKLPVKVPGYRVAVKPELRRKSVPTVEATWRVQTIASFIGMLPAENPQLLCLVLIDNPRTGGGWGNTVAGPAFNAIAEESARYLGIPAFNLDGASDFVKERMKRIKHVPPPSLTFAAELAAKEPPSATRNKPAASGAPSLAKTFSLVALLTFVSKFIGLARDIIVIASLRCRRHH